MSKQMWYMFGIVSGLIVEGVLHFVPPALDWSFGWSVSFGRTAMGIVAGWIALVVTFVWMISCVPKSDRSSLPGHSK